MDNPGPGVPARAQMTRTLALCDEVSRFLEQTCGTSPAEIDLVGVGLLTRAAHRELTPEARMCELQALVRRWVHEGPPAALPGRAHDGARGTVLAHAGGMSPSGCSSVSTPFQKK